MSKNPSPVRLSKGLMMSMAAGACAAIWVSGCAPRSRESDAGDYSFVHQAVPKMYGRKAKGHAETRMLADFIAATDRKTLIEAMGKTPDFKKQWAENLVDMLRMDREGTKAQDACLGGPLRAAVDNGQLAAHIRDNPPATPAPGGPYNLSDVILSALELDDMFPVWRAWLFAMQSKPLTGAQITQQNIRDDMGGEFQSVFMHRKLDCMACHNSQFSTTGPASGWNRHVVIPGFFEKAVYGKHRGRDPVEANAVFRSDVGGALKPWGMQNCGSFNPAPPADPLVANAYFTRALGSAGSIWTVDGALALGRADLDMGGLERTNSPEDLAACELCSTCIPAPASPVDPESSPHAAAVAAIISSRCISCHSGPGGQGNLDLSGPDWAGPLIRASNPNGGPPRVLPGDPDGSFLYQLVRDDEMPKSGPPLSAAQKQSIRDWIQNLPAYLACADCEPGPCDGTARTVDGEAGLAFLLAAHISNQVWTENLGYPLTVAHYFPRNAGQRDLSWNLAEYNFINSGWSLRTLLKKILTSEYFNRKAPYLADGTEPYELPMFYDPWVERDPRVPVSPANPDGAKLHHNAMTEAIHRYSPRSLLASAGSTMGWPGPLRFPSAAYPDAELAKDMGQYSKAAEPGFREVGFQSLLRWESVHGGGRKPPGVTGTDWIDRTMVQAGTFNAAHPSEPLTYLDLAITVKDWLINEREIRPEAFGELMGEFDALRAVLGTANLNLPAPLSTPAERQALEDGLRRFAGVLMESPQFWLAGIGPTEGIGPADAPRLRVCNDGPCSYQEMCEAFAPFANIALPGRALRCSADSLEIITLPSPSPPGRHIPVPVELCPGKLCGFVELDCIDNLWGCRPQPPSCDPRCAQIDCCGGPLPPLDRKGYLLLWADLGKIKRAEGVGLVRGDSKRPVPLQAGSVLRFGDLLLVDGASDLDIRVKEGGFRLRPGELKGLPKGSRQALLITGPEALQPDAVARMEPQPWRQVDEQKVKAWIQSMPWLAYGSAGGHPHPKDVSAPDPGHASRRPLMDTGGLGNGGKPHDPRK
jgi:hypothetical protein